MNLRSKRPARRTAAGTQKWMSVRMVAARERGGLDGLV